MPPQPSEQASERATMLAFAFRLAQQSPDRPGPQEGEKDQEGKDPNGSDPSRPKRDKAPPDNDPPDDQPNPRGPTALARTPYSEP
jgi:hypothetical protein